MEIKHKIAIIGATSKTAEAMIRLFIAETDWDILLCTASTEYNFPKEVTVLTIDYEYPKQIRELFLEHMPTVIINTAAITNVDACEVDKKKSWNVNVTWAEQLCRTAAILDAHFIHFSSDYVFDGKSGPYTESDVPNPISYYGKSKLASENACKISYAKTTIIRTNVVYGYSSHNKIDFVQWIINMCELNKSFGVVNDQLSNPTLTDDIALGIKKIIEKKRTGLYHFGGLDFINRIYFAKKIAEIYHLDDSLIQPITTESLNQKAKRPLQSGLISLKASTDLGVKFCGIESGLITLRHQMHVFSQYSK